MVDQTGSEKPAAWLQERAHNVYSQEGEDGVIEAIFEVLPERDRWCVEFGAWDGLYLTNTRHLIESEEYSAVLIEADNKKFVDLQANHGSNERVHPINAFVGYEGDQTLDKLLASTPIPKNFDLLSVDIDGNDYHVWKALREYQPKVVVVEFNPTIPTNVDYVQPADPKVSHGSSVSAFAKLGKEMGYELVCLLPFNAFFVKAEYYPLFGISDNSVHTLRVDERFITYVFTAYDGSVFVEGRNSLPWHGVAFSKRKLQHLPSFLRTFPANYNLPQKVAFKAYKAWCELRTLPERIFSGKGRDAA